MTNLTTPRGTARHDGQPTATPASAARPVEAPLRRGVHLLATALAATLLAGCEPAAVQAARVDPLCAAVDDVHASGLVAALSGAPRLLGEERDVRDADTRAARAAEAVARFRAAAPEEISADAERVAAALQQFTLALNNPLEHLLGSLQAAGRTPAEREQFQVSVARVNAVTEERCGRPLLDPALAQP